MSKKLSRAERKQIRAKAARLRADPSDTPAAAKPAPHDEPAQAQALRSQPVSRRVEAARAASRSRRQAQSRGRTEPEERQAEPEPAREKKSALGRFAARLTDRKKRGEHAVLVFLSLVVLAAVIVFVAQRGRPARMVPDPANAAEHAPDKPAAHASDPPSPEPLPPQDDHSPPTIVTAPVKPPPAASSVVDRGSADHAGAAAKPPDAKPKPASPPPKPSKPPAPPPSEEPY